ncbi:hypothetical protein B0T14DRAFT_607335 [Immersiella caudata]|uniref:Fungal N-terminal domain-containing protein n=1 Tax=Immersiella caudata TaxID=314043 RepID=A0AA39TSF6_9PEZI|nr:hypothetical protein B0T14DRAFT_607335 [Immersiella caudata]
MDPLSTAASAFSLAGGIAKALVAPIEFSRQACDAAADLDAISREIQVLNAVLQPLVQCTSQGRSRSSIPDALAAQIGSTIDGCKLVTKWVMLGEADLQKLRDSLEAYKMALSLGMHAVGMNLNQAIKDNTDDIQKEIAGIRVNVDEILLRVNGIRQKGSTSTRNSRVEH